MLCVRGGYLDGPPGNGNFAPVVKRTSLPVAVAITGAPDPLNEIAPIQPVGSAPTAVIHSGLNVRVVSGGAAVKTGASIFRKCVKGVASSPGGGLITARSRRYSGRRIKTLRRKLVRVAVELRSPLLAAASTAFTCARTSSGHADERATIFATDDLTVSASPRFAAMRVDSTRPARLSGVGAARSRGRAAA